MYLAFCLCCAWAARAGCADGFLGSGSHQIQGIEIYKGKPIFYSLPDFIQQHDLIPKTPRSSTKAARARGRVKMEARKEKQKITTVPLTGIRKIISERLVKSHLAAPHVTLTREIDASALKIFREKLLKQVEGIRISYTHLLVKACVEALREYPIVNSRLEGDQIKLLEQMNIGVAVATEAGLLVPVIRNADKMSLIEIAAESDKLISKANKGILTLSELTGGTFTVTNLGMFGIDAFTPIINPPESAILGVGRLIEKPIAVEGRIEVRPTMVLSLTFDHRVMDGALAAQFLRKLVQVLEKPDETNHFKAA